MDVCVSCGLLTFSLRSLSLSRLWALAFFLSLSLSLCELLKIDFHNNFGFNAYWPITLPSIKVGI